MAGGNPATEVLLTVLKKKGLDLAIDPNKVMDISQKLIRPLVRGKGIDTIDIASGYAGFHSSYLSTILKYAREYDMDPRVLIEEVCKEDRVEASEDLVCSVAKRVQSLKRGEARVQVVSLPRISFSDKGADQAKESMSEALQKIARKAANSAKKKGKQSVLNIVAPMYPDNGLTVSRFIQEDFDYVVASVELDSENYLPDVIKAADGVVDIFLVDCDVKACISKSLYTQIKTNVQKSRLFGYRDSEVWTRAVEQEIRCILSDVSDFPILICGSDHLSISTGLALAEQGAKIVFLDQGSDRLSSLAGKINPFYWLKNPISISGAPCEAAREVKAIVSFSRCYPVVTPEMISAMDPEGIVFDAGIGGISQESMILCNQLGIRVVRPDMRAALASELASLLGKERIVKELMGRKEIAGVSLVAGGLLGVRGEVVVDSISNPSKVIGIADGRGFLVEDDAQNEEEKSKILTINNEILRQLIS